jgi:hypothetical protein
VTISVALRAKLNAQAKESCPVLTVDEFFEGNDDLGSIGCNLSPAPPLEVFRRVLLGIAARPDVQSVLVRVTEDMGDEWPFSDLLRPDLRARRGGRSVARRAPAGGSVRR